METTLRSLVDLLPTESLELYVQAYEGGGVGGYMGQPTPIAVGGETCPRCPRASLGFSRSENFLGIGASRAHDGHPAWAIEMMARSRDLDTAALYDECVWAIAERDGALGEQSEEPERKPTATL